MKVLIKMFKPLIKKVLRKELEKQDNQDLVVGIINEKLDIPKLTEAEEKKLLDQVYDAVEESALTLIDRI